MVICCFDFGCLLLLPFCAGRECGLRIFGLSGFMVVFDLGFSGFRIAWCVAGWRGWLGLGRVGLVWLCF